MKRHLVLSIHVLWIFALASLASAASGSDLTAQLQAVIDDFLAANPQAPGVVVHIECPPLGLDRVFTAGAEDRDCRRCASVGSARNAFRREGKASDLGLCQRRTEPSRHVGL